VYNGREVVLCDLEHDFRGKIDRLWRHSCDMSWVKLMEALAMLSLKGVRDVAYVRWCLATLGVGEGKKIESELRKCLK